MSFKHVLPFKFVLSLIRFCVCVCVCAVLSLYTGNGFFSITVIVFIAHAREFKIIQKLEDTHKSLCTWPVNMLSLIEQQGSALVWSQSECVILLRETACSYFLFNILFFRNPSCDRTSFTEIHMFCFSSRLVVLFLFLKQDLSEQVWGFHVFNNITDFCFQWNVYSGLLCQ